MPGGAFDRLGLARSVLQRLPALHEARGERQQAARYYTTFVRLWGDADPAFQERVAAARSRLAALIAEG